MTWKSTARNLLAGVGVAAVVCALLLVGITVGVRAARGIVIRTVNVPAVPAPGPPGGPMGLMMSPKEYSQVGWPGVAAVEPAVSGWLGTHR